MTIVQRIAEYCAQCDEPTGKVIEDAAKKFHGLCSNCEVVQGLRPWNFNHHTGTYNAAGSGDEGEPETDTDDVMNGTQCEGCGSREFTLIRTVDLYNNTESDPGDTILYFSTNHPEDQDETNSRVICTNCERTNHDVQWEAN